MKIFMVLVAVMVSAMASPYTEKQDKDTAADINFSYNDAQHDLQNVQINNGKNWRAVCAQNLLS